MCTKYIEESCLLLCGKVNNAIYILVKNWYNFLEIVLHLVILSYRQQCLNSKRWSACTKYTYQITLIPYPLLFFEGTTSLPYTIFSGSSTSVVEGSILWLYCEVKATSSSLSVSWNKDGKSLIQDVPHIRLRTSTSSSSTTLLLVLDNVVCSDTGVYQCTAQDGLDNDRGLELNVTGECLIINYFICEAVFAG